MLAVFLLIGGGFLVWFGAWSLIPTLQGLGFNYPDSYYQNPSQIQIFQQYLVGGSMLGIGIACFVALVVLFVRRRKFLFPTEKQLRL